MSKTLLVIGASEDTADKFKEACDDIGIEYLDESCVDIQNLQFSSLYRFHANFCSSHRIMKRMLKYLSILTISCKTPSKRKRTKIFSSCGSI